MQYWLFKTEPGCFGWDNLVASPNQTTSWDGVRNYQARNLMQSMRLGDKGFFYHSGKDPEIIGIVNIVKEAYPDHFAWNVNDEHFDARSTPEKPIWYMVDVQLERQFPKPITRKELSKLPYLADMELMKKGSRLSVQPVRKEEFEFILSLI